MTYHNKPATYVGHVEIRVENLDRALQFYHDVIGFNILERDSSRAKLTADGQTCILSIIEPVNVIPKQRRTTGLYHFAVLLPSRSDLAQMVIRLVEHGITIGASDHLVSEAIYFEDPDGNGIEIYADRDPSEWIWEGKEVSMASKPLDFDDLLKTKPEQPWIKLPKDTLIGHIHLHVSNLQKAEDFYTNGLGFGVVAIYGTEALFLSTSGYHHHIAVNTWNGVGAPPPPNNSVGLDHFTLVYPDQPALEKVVEGLKQNGLKVVPKNGRYLVADPSDNLVELSHAPMHFRLA